MNCPSCQAANREDAENCFSCGKGLYVLTEGALVDSRYEVLSPLGRGGMGMVYKAHDRELDEVVALKVLRPEVAASAEMARRFRSEIRLARKVRHRNVCGIHEYGQDGHIRFIAMEFIDGLNLKEALREKGPLAPGEAYEVAITLAEGLQAIHQEGIVHRDLKTANIMRDSRGVVRLMDFGIAKEWRPDSDIGTTATGQVVGTPEYMSPEQVRGEKIDFRSDVYALGNVVFELFTGQVPFHSDTPAATFLKHLQEPAPLEGPGATRLPASLVPVLRKALSKDRDARFQTVRDMAQALRQARDASPTENRAAVEPPLGATGTLAKGQQTPALPSVPATPLAVESPRATRPLFRVVSWLLALSATFLAALFLVNRARLSRVESPDLGAVHPSPTASRAAAVPRDASTGMGAVLPSAGLPRLGPSTPAVIASGQAGRVGSLAVPRKIPLDVQQQSFPPLAGQGTPKLSLDAVALEKACGTGVADACNNLGMLFTYGQGVPKDERRGVTLFARACEGGHLGACAGLGFAYAVGQGVAKDEGRALALYNKACNGKNPLGCYNLGVVYGEGRLVPKNDTQAAALFQQACAGGYAAACLNLGSRVLQAQGVAKDEAKAGALFKQACDGGDARGCLLLGVMYRDGLGGPKSEAGAAGLFKRACEGGEVWGCYNLAHLYRNGQGVTRDAERAVALLKQACTGGHSQGCDDLGYLYQNGDGVAKDEQGGAALFKQSCESGLAMGCNNLAAAYQAGRGVPKDQTRAFALYNQACDGGELLGCHNLGWMYVSGEGVARDPARGAGLFKRACDGGTLGACAALGIMYAGGVDFPRDPALAAPLFKKACDGGIQPGCAGLGKLYEHGDGVATDPVQAASLYKRACDGGVADACLGLASMLMLGKGLHKDQAEASALFKQACDAGNTEGCERLRTLGSSESPSLSGTWTGFVHDGIGGSGALRVTLLQSGNSLSGAWQVTFPASPSANNGGALTGIVEVDSISAKLTSTNPSACGFTLTAVRAASRITGTYESFNCAVSVIGSIDATKQ